jgi:hypothetical protein
MVNVAEVVLLGVPVMAPVLLLREAHVGSAPVETA